MQRLPFLTVCKMVPASGPPHLFLSMQQSQPLKPKKSIWSPNLHKGRVSKRQLETHLKYGLKMTDLKHKTASSFQFHE